MQRLLLLRVLLRLLELLRKHRLLVRWNRFIPIGAKRLLLLLHIELVILWLLRGRVGVLIHSLLLTECLNPFRARGLGKRRVRERGIGRLKWVLLLVVRRRLGLSVELLLLGVRLLLLLLLLRLLHTVDQLLLPVRALN